MSRYRLKAIYDEVYGITAEVNTAIPLNTPIMFIRMGAKGKGRLGFKRIASRGEASPTPTNTYKTSNVKD